MRYGASFRVAPGVYIHRSGGGAVFMALFLCVCYVALRLYALMIFAAIVAAVLVAFLGLVVAGYFMTSNRLKELQARAVQPSSVRLDGNYTHPRTWGVYKVEAFKNGARGPAFHLGNHPVRQNELIREFGSAEVVLLFTSRTDAQELKYLLNTNRVSAI
jgi:hypothetical protein